MEENLNSCLGPDIYDENTAVDVRRFPNRPSSAPSPDERVLELTEQDKLQQPMINTNQRKAQMRLSLPL